MNDHCFFQNAIMPVEEAKLSLNDLGIIRGYGVFDFLRTYNLRPFLLRSYLDRFLYSAQAMGLDLPFDRAGLEAIVHDLLDINDIKEDVGIRLILTGGPAADGMTVHSPVFYILIEELHEPPHQYFEHGAALISQEYMRPLPDIKTTYYLNAVRQWRDCNEKDVMDILYHYEGNILETSRSNFFIFKEDTLVTPVENILKGRIRNLVLQLAEPHFKIKEKNISWEDLETADEAFITGTTKMVMPITQIDERKMSAGKPGNNTKKLLLLFREYISGN